jgi:hydrogenase-4 component B
MTEIGPVLLVLALATPLALALLAPLLARPTHLLPWAAVPGLGAALLAPQDAAIELPVPVLGLSVTLDRIGAIFLGFGSLLWLLAGAYARGYLTGSQRLASFSVFWLTTLAGTLGTFVAADVVTFYLSFSVMSLAAYGLIIHDRTASARRAGRVYIIMAVFGETSLLAAIMLAATHADSLLIADIRANLATSPWSDYILAGLLIGFGIKAGLVPLHVWLPLAHPEAPTPASAVLSGVIVKAGIIGLIRLLPMDAASAWGDALIILGLATTYYGILAGLAQANAKAILAYSTLSQMGLVVAVLGSGIGELDAARSLDAAALYATHHGLAKGALFLSVGIAAASGARPLRPFMVVTALTALAIAGLPLSGGALAKLAIKEPLGHGSAAMLVTLSAVGTAMLMLRFFAVMAQQNRQRVERAAPYHLAIPWAGMVAAAVVVPWMLFSQLSGQAPALALAPAGSC